MVIDDHQSLSRIALVGWVVVLLECSLLVKVHTVGGQNQVGTRSSAVVLQGNQLRVGKSSKVY